ncbi:hypothetical protein GE21DRAFT_1082814 [Neurospora crassa]|nr:hypothetical protein GE21DRAFT_1082814 [Neurospora crassa]
MPVGGWCVSCEGFWSVNELKAAAKSGRVFRPDSTRLVDRALHFCSVLKKVLDTPPSPSSSTLQFKVSLSPPVVLLLFLLLLDKTCSDRPHFLTRKTASFSALHQSVPSDLLEPAAKWNSYPFKGP